METYKNDYNKREDYMLWELHEIRHKMALNKLNPDEINKNALRIIKKYKLNNLRLIKNP